MGFKRFLKKAIIDSSLPLGAGYVVRILKSKKEGESILDTIKRDTKETIYEDHPLTSPIYKAGHHDGEKDGRAKQAETDSKKFDEMKEQHKKDEYAWRETDKAKDDYIRRQKEEIKERDDIIDGLSEND